jgi:uncharacterized repeat protein (TIGR01451 family)
MRRVYLALSIGFCFALLTLFWVANASDVALATTFSTGPASPSTSQSPTVQDWPPTVVTLDNGYRITFLGVIYNADGTSTWRYYVEELPSAQDLSNWVLELPDCASVVTAWPEPWEVVMPDPNAHLDGIKWQTGAGFEEGEFTVTLAGPLALGQTQVAAMGPDLGYGVIAGPVCGIDLSITKSDWPDPATVGEPLTYTITVTNASFDDATNVVVTDTLPSSVSFGSATPSQGSCSGTDPVVCNLGTLTSGATATITIVATPTVEGIIITNQAQVMGSEPDPNLENNIATEDTVVRPAADLSITKSDWPDPATVEEPLTYTITITNAGPDDATDVTVTDTLPMDVAFGSATPSQGSCSGTNPVICDLGTLTSGATATVTIVVTPTVEGIIITNQAEVAGTELDPDPANNMASQDTAIRPAADLSIAKSDWPDPATVGEPLTYTITITNAGPDDATDVTVTDTLPIDVDFGTATPSQGSCSGTNPVICDLGTLTSGATATITIVVTPTMPGIIINLAEVTGAEPDPDPGNNEVVEETEVLGATANNCTYTQGYWKNHPDAWPVENITIGGVTYTQAEAIAIFNTEPDGDATYILAHQLIAAKLNILNGADPSAVATTIDQADDWLTTHPLGSDPPHPDREQAIVLSETLDDYNNGLIGPGHCDKIEFDYFKAYRSGEARITLAWQTFTEIDISGFNIHRAPGQDGPYAKINDGLIEAEGDVGSGASYSYQDTDVDSGSVYYYDLEYVTDQGVGAFYGPVPVTEGQIYLPLIIKAD